MPEPENDEQLATVFQNRWVKLIVAVLVGGIVLYVLGALIYRLRGVLLPFGLAAVGAYVLNPLVEFLEAKLRWPRLVIVVLLMSLLTVIVVTALSFGVYYAVVSIEELGARAQKAIETGGEAEGLVGEIQDSLQQLPATLRAEIEKAIEALPDQVREHFAPISQSVLRAVGSVARVILSFVLASFDFVLFFVIAGYLLIDWPAIQRKARHLLPAWHKEDVLRVAGTIDTDMRAFFRGQLLVALALSAVYTIGLVLCGVPFGLIIGVVAGLANIVPYLGIAVGLVPALLLTLVPYTGLFKPIGVVVTYTAGQTLEGFFLTPKIVGQNVGLSPVVVILAILIFAELFGFIGVVFAVPLASVCKVLLGEFLRYYRRFQEPESADASPG